MLHTVVDFALFHNHPHVQCRLLRKQKIIVSYRNARGITCIVSCVVRIARGIAYLSTVDYHRYVMAATVDKRLL